MNTEANFETVKGARAYVARYVATELLRPDFVGYIQSRLDPDFVCALAKHLEALQPPSSAQATVLADLVEVCNDLNSGADEFDHDDGLYYGAPYHLWDEFRTKLDSAEQALCGCRSDSPLAEGEGVTGG